MSYNKNLPKGDIYELEYKYWPWGKLIDFIYNWIVQHTPQSGYIVDYMCGTGYLLNKISIQRKDLFIEGCSINKENIDYGKSAYKNIRLYRKDVFDFKPTQKASTIIAAGGLHHLVRSKQKPFIIKVYKELASNGYFILGEEVIRDYKNNIERIDSVNEFFLYLINEVVKNENSPSAIKKAVMDLYKIDILEQGEFKSSLEMILKLTEKHFIVESINKIWPEVNVLFGDVVFVLKKKS